MVNILFYSHLIDYGGTWRSHERLLLNLSDEFNVHIAYWDEGNNNRLDFLKQKINLIPFQRSKQRSGNFHSPNTTNFHEIIEKYDFDIVHFARSGYPEWPFDRRFAKVQIETNIFGDRDNSGFCDYSFAISDYINEIRGCDKTLWNPCEPAKSGSNLRSKYNIPQDAMVLGRIGRPANFHPIAINAYKQLQKKHNLYYIIVAPCDNTKRSLSGVDNVIFIEPTNNDELIGDFYRTIDIFAHYRLDGETQGTAIADAMMYKIPVVSHISNHHNGHVKTIGEAGKVCTDQEEYITYLEWLIMNPKERKQIGEIGKSRATENFLTEKVVKEAEKTYLEILA